MSRRSVIIVVLALFAGLFAYGLTRLAMRPPAVAEPEAQLEWLAGEFGLDARAKAEVARLQEEYEPVCADHCAAIAHGRAALRDAGSDPAARAAAEAELTRLKQVCADSTRAHLHAVAALMAPAQAARFLALMEPKVAHQDGRVGAPSLSPAGTP